MVWKKGKGACVGTLGIWGWSCSLWAQQGGDRGAWQELSMAVGECWPWQVTGLKPYPTTLTVGLRELNLVFEQQRSNGARGRGPGGPGEHGVHGG